MELIETLVVVVHVIVAAGVIGLVLLQQGKGADMGAAFGAGASQTLFGSQGSGNFLTKMTSLLAIVFFVSSFALAVFAKQKSEEIAQQDFVPQVIESAPEQAVPALDDATPPPAEEAAADEGKPVLE
ncbi:preprotein translocase subunit SecG [Hahella sp. CCB-MM4]|uniref:preprotein translocase subunit SecG n=1 Tax=Hahella sp. (strain CCB-MM4) TaxID=1926491 RepID=UPI000B9B2A32|nr:preprotein translocase subunit SecG [Hahella sp. CCB-MM4]OZG71701.1 preprotein translocase subunit SecG [Hahella sp. CCB-MM4]